MSRIAQHIVDPRLLSDELGDPHPDMYSGLASYVFGDPRPSSRSSSSSSSSSSSDAADSIGPLTPIARPLSHDYTPRPSVSGLSPSPPFHNVSSHPSQGAGRHASSLHPPSSQSRRHSTTRDSSYPTAPSSSRSRPRVVSESESERSQDPTSSTDPISAAFSSPHRTKVLSDNASQHTFGHSSRTHGVTAASSQDGPTPSSSSVSVTTSRSSSRASMCTAEQFSSDDELEIDYYDGTSSPVTFARDILVDIDEDVDLTNLDPSTLRPSILDGRRGSLPIAIPGAVQVTDPYNRSREGSILTLRRPSRSWDAASARRSSYGGEDPTIVLPKSEPLSRADWLSLEAKLQAKQQQQQQQVEANVYDGLDLQYILSKHSEGSIRSFSSRLSFVQGTSGPPRSSPHLSSIALGQGSSTTLPFEDSFMRHLEKHDRAFDSLRYYWSFQREKADGSTSSLRRRQQAHRHQAEKSRKDIPSRMQEMWRCGHVGRYKVDRLVLKPQSTESAKGIQQRIHIRHIPDPFLMGNTTTGPHSVIHKHSRAIAFSIFRSHSLFSGRHAGESGVGPSGPQTHMNMRYAIMLATKKVQEQYTSTKTTRQLSTHGLLDNESRNSRDKERDKGSRRGTQSLPFRERDSRDKERRRGQEKEARGKGKGKGKGKEKSDKKHRMNQTESADSSTATSSAGSISNSAIQHVVSAFERPMMRIQFSPSTSSSTSVYKRDTVSRPGSSTSLLPPSTNSSGKVPESETSSIPSTRHHRDHRDSVDSDDRFPARTTHAEAFSALDPNDIESLRVKANGRGNADSGSRFTERLFQLFRGSSRSDDHSSTGIQPRAFQPPWLITAGRDQQEENDRVLNDLSASFRDVGLLHTNPHKTFKSASKRRSNQGILDQIPDDCLYMLLPLWPGESDIAGAHSETSSAASFVTIPENRQYLLVYYVPFVEATPKDKKPEKKKAKQSHSSDSGVEDPRIVYLPAFRAVARMVTYDELRLSGVRVPSNGLAISGPEWEAIHCPLSVPLRDAQMIGTVVCQCYGRERGFDFLEHGLLKLGLCTREEIPTEDHPEPEEDEREGKTVLTPIGRAAVEMIWLGCLAITSFGPI